MGLIPCSSCQRHVRSEEKACPFCGARAAEPGLARGGFAAFAAAAALAIAGCGGKAAPETTPPPENEDDPTEIDAGVEDPIDQPPPDDFDRGGTVQPLYGVDRQ